VRGAGAERIADSVRGPPGCCCCPASASP